MPTTPTATPFAIEAFELAGSRFGPRREPPSYVAGERVWIRLLARGLGRDEAGDVALGVGIGLDRPEADVRALETLRAPDLFGAAALPVAVSFPLPPGVPPGKRELTVALEDRATGARQTIRAAVEVRPLERGPVALNPYFAADAEGAIERPGEFHVGETMHLIFGVIGLEPAGGSVRCEADLEVREAAAPGRPISRRRRVLALESPAREGVPALDAAVSATATAPGTFLIRVVVRDLNTGREAAIERAATVRP